MRLNSYGAPMCDDCVGICKKCRTCVVQPSSSQGMKTKHVCSACGREFVVDHWSDSRGTPATCLITSDGAFGPYCSPRCRTDAARAVEVT